MINPSVHGWIEKYFAEVPFAHLRDNLSAEKWYEQLRETGFIYGHTLQLPGTPNETNALWSAEERSKIALLYALFSVYQLTTKQQERLDFTQRASAFYQEMSPVGIGQLWKNLLPTSPSQKLESFIDGRVQTNKDIFRKNFSHIVTNALLFVDVLAFRHFLLKGSIPDKYLKRIEETLMGLVSLALRVKGEKTVHDDLLIKLFDASVRYTKFSKINITAIQQLPFEAFKDPLESYYFLDMAALALWNDGKIENEEKYFVYALGQYLQVEDSFTETALAFTHHFISTHRSEMHYFNYSHPVKHFYDQTAQSVIFLIKRNKKRLTKEIRESKELMQLLAQSTQRDLDAEEKKKIKKQLLDVCKTIPSLTIFLLPGGSLLLPLLIKFIPQLLPSAFNENLED